MLIDASVRIKLWLEFTQQCENVVCVFAPRSAHPAQLHGEQQRVRRLVRRGTAQLTQCEPARIWVKLHHVAENTEGGNQHKPTDEGNQLVTLKKKLNSFHLLIIY